MEDSQKLQVAAWLVDEVNEGRDMDSLRGISDDIREARRDVFDQQVETIADRLKERDALEQ